jgi:hypothetical protein
VAHDLTVVVGDERDAVRHRPEVVHEVGHDPAVVAEGDQVHRSDAGVVALLLAPDLHGRERTRRTSRPARLV